MPQLFEFAPSHQPSCLALKGDWYLGLGAEKCVEEALGYSPPRDCGLGLGSVEKRMEAEAKGDVFLQGTLIQRATSNIVLGSR